MNILPLAVTPDPRAVLASARQERPEPAVAIDPVQAQFTALWRYLRMHGATPEQAEDLAQEAFVIAVRKGALQFEPAAAFAFLQRTARHLFLRGCRQRGSRPAALADAVDALWQRDCSDGGGDLLVTVRDCVGKLGDRARRAVEIAYGLGGEQPASRARIAAELGLQENGVKTLLQRAREALRSCVDRKRRTT